MKLPRYRTGCIILIFLLFIISPDMHARYNCLFHHYSTQDGLSHGKVTAIIKDSDGFMWFGTIDGINRFDGYNFKTYKTRPGDNVSLSSNRIEALIEDKYGYLWLRTYDSKVYRFDKKKEEFISLIENDRSVRFFRSVRGDVWLITESNGAYRFVNDEKTKTLKQSHFCSNCELPGFPGDTVYFTEEDIDTNLWMGTNGGLVCLQYNNSTQNYSIKQHSKANLELINGYHFILFAEYGNSIFFGSSEGKVFYYSRASDKFTELNIFNTSPITSIYVCDNGSILISTNGHGIFKYDFIKHKLVNSRSDKITKNIQAMYVDSYGNIWMETEKNGVTKLSSDFQKANHYQQESDVSPTLQLRNHCNFVEDLDKVLWINMKGSGFGYYNQVNDEIEYFYNQPSDPTKKISNFVSSFYIDTTGVMWLCTYYKGIEKITFLQDKFRHTYIVPGAVNKIENEVRSIYEDSKKNLWVGTKQGSLYQFNTAYRKIKTFNVSNQLNKGLVYSITEDKHSNIWLATKGKGVFNIISSGNGQEGYTFKHYSENCADKCRISNDNVYSIVEDSKGRIWIGTYGGGINVIIDPESDSNVLNISNSFKNYPTPVALKIRQVLEDSKGNIWLATTNGLIFFNPNNKSFNDIDFITIKKIPGDEFSLGNNDILCIGRDLNDTLWFGTIGGGLNKLIGYPSLTEPARFKNYSRSDGLSSDVILSILPDKNNNLWVSTENGLSVLENETRTFRNFDEYDGLTLTSFSEATSCLKSNGEIVFGTFDGLYSIYPDDLQNSPKKISLQITDFQVLSEQGNSQAYLKNHLSTQYPIKLKYDQNMFSIEFVGLDYRAQHKIQYAYMLEGFDDKWMRAKNQRIATYTNIPPGTYVFKVRFGNPELQSANRSEELSIIILQPPWKTTWAYFGYILLGLVLLEIIRRTTLSFISLRNKVVVEQELTNLKLRFFTNISHELRTPLTLILGPIDDIAKKEKLSDQGKEHLLILEKNARRMLRLINQILDFRKIQNKKMKVHVSPVEIVTFLHDITANFKDLARQKNIGFTVNTSIDNAILWIDAEKIDIVIFNLLSNAFKFTPSGKSISVSINKADISDNIVIQVKDEGIGIPSEKVSDIFTRFADIHRHSGLKDTGSGIGLSLSKEFIDMHKGNIYFSSVEHIGTTFTIELKSGKEHFDKEIVEFTEENTDQPELSPGYPTGTEVIQALTNPFIHPDNGSLPLIMIVEDDADLRKFIANQFVGIYEIVEAGNGKTGFQLAEKYQPDLIISDIMMPELDGIELTDKLRNNFSTSHIPIILLTAKSSIESRLEGLKYGADDYITKPFDSEYLIARINNLLQLRKSLYNKFSDQVRRIDFTVNSLAVTEKDEAFLKAVTKIVEENLDNSSFQIDSIVKETGLGRTNFFKKLKSLTGLAPIEFVNEIRLKKAASFIESLTYTISEVAYKAGFNDAGYFTKCFKEKYGCTPSNYIKSKKSEK